MHDSMLNFMARMIVLTNEVCGGLGLSFQMLIPINLHQLDSLIRCTILMSMKCWGRCWTLLIRLGARCLVMLRLIIQYALQYIDLTRFSACLTDLVNVFEVFLPQQSLSSGGGCNFISLTHQTNTIGQENYVYATSMTMELTAVVSVFLFGFHLFIAFFLGSIVLSMSMYLHSIAKPQR